MADEQVVVKPTLSLADLDNPATPEETAAEDARIKSEAEANQRKMDEEKAAKEKEATENSHKTEDQLAAEKKAAEEKETADLKLKEEAETADAVTEENFYEAVDKQHGFTDFKVEYGDTDPLGPEGAYIREKALMDKAVADFESYLKKEDPRGYAYLLHSRAGGSDEDFFKTPSVNLPDYDTLKNDVDLQKSLYEKDLKAKGLDQDSINLIVEKAIKDSKLFDRADQVYKAREAADRQMLADLEKQNTQVQQEEQKAVQAMNSVLDDIITNSKTDHIIIPDAKKGEFGAWVKQNMFFDGTNFFLIKGLNKDNAAEILQGEYFGFVKGNLSDVVRRQAKTENTASVRRRLAKDSKETRTTTTETQASGSYIPLSDIN